MRSQYCISNNIANGKDHRLQRASDIVTESVFDFCKQNGLNFAQLKEGTHFGYHRLHNRHSSKYMKLHEFAFTPKGYSRKEPAIDFCYGLGLVYVLAHLEPFGSTPVDLILIIADFLQHNKLSGKPNNIESLLDYLIKEKMINLALKQVLLESLTQPKTAKSSVYYTKVIEACKTFYFSNHPEHTLEPPIEPESDSALNNITDPYRALEAELGIESALATPSANLLLVMDYNTDAKNHIKNGIAANMRNQQDSTNLFYNIGLAYGLIHGVNEDTYNILDQHIVYLINLSQQYGISVTMQDLLAYFAEKQLLDIEISDHLNKLTKDPLLDPIHFQTRLSFLCQIAADRRQQALSLYSHPQLSYALAQENNPSTFVTATTTTTSTITTSTTTRATPGTYDAAPADRAIPLPSWTSLWLDEVGTPYRGSASKRTRV